MHNDTQQHAPPAAVAQETPVRRGRRGDGKRDQVIKVRVTVDEIIRLEMAAYAQKMERATWARRALLLQADREASYAPPPPVTLCPRDKAVMDRFAVTVSPALLPALTTTTTEETEDEGDHT